MSQFLDILNDVLRIVTLQPMRYNRPDRADRPEHESICGGPTRFRCERRGERFFG